MPAVPHDFSEAPSSELNNAVIENEAELLRWPDQQLVVCSWMGSSTRLT